MQQIAIDHFLQIVQQSSDAIITTDTNLVVTSWNPAAERLYGFTKEEATGQRLGSLLRSRLDEQRVLQELGELRQKGFCQGEYKYQNKQGETIFIDASVSILKANDGSISGYVATHRNLTDRKLKEQQLKSFQADLEEQARLSNERLSMHLTNSPLAVIEWNTSSVITSWSDHAVNIFGWEKNEAVGSTIGDLNLVYPDDIPLVSEVIDLVFKGSESRTKAVNRNITKTGKVIYCQWYNSVLRDNCGSIISCMSIVQDITEKKEAEDILAFSRQQLDLIYNSSTDILYLLDVEPDHKFRFTSVNNAFLKATGLTSEQIIGKYVHEVIPYPSSELVMSKYREAVEKRETLYWEEVTPYPTGVKTGMVSITPVYDKEGQCIRLVGSVHDITEIKRAEAELREKNDQLRKLSAYLQDVREEERTNIAREIHDELGERLTGIRLDISWIENHLTSSNSTIKEKFPPLIQLVDDTIKTVRKISTELRPSILDDFGLTDALEWQATEFEKRTGIRCMVKSTVKENITNKKIEITLFRIFQESLTNILRHAKARKVVVQLLRQEDSLELTIVDDGVGMDLATVYKKRTLGLIGMKERVNMVNGHYNITSSPGKGTTITVSVPGN